jgi:hypothetical protein
MKKGTEKTKIAAKTLKRVSSMKTPEVKKSPYIPTEVMAMGARIKEDPNFDEYDNSQLKRIGEQNEYLFKGLPSKVVTDPKRYDKFDPMLQETMPSSLKTKNYDRFTSDDIKSMKDGAQKVLKKLKKKNAK